MVAIKSYCHPTMVLRLLTVSLLTLLTTALTAQGVDCDEIVPDLIGDTTICQGTPLFLLRSPLEGSLDADYTLLSGGEVLRTARNPNFSVRLDRDTTFTILTESDNGACSERQTVSIKVVPGLFDIPQDTIFSCLGTDSITLSVATDSFLRDAVITWSPNRFSARPARGSTFRVQPRADITYYAQADVNGCARIDSVAVRLDSLPQDLSLELEPPKDTYCQGDTFYVRSPIYDAGDFPIITHQWTEAPGIQSPRGLYNAVFSAQDSALLTRVTSNGSCVDTATIQVNVIEPPQFRFEPVDPVVCPGEPLPITATLVSGQGTLSWQDPNNTLSCTDCLDPVATVQSTTEYEIKVNTGGTECSSTLSYTVTVEPSIDPVLTDAVQLCAGDSRQLIIGDTVAGNTYRITGGGVDISDISTLVSPTETTTYTVESTGRCGTSTQQITLFVVDDYTVTASGPATICVGAPLSLSAAVDPANVEGSYTWTLPNGSTQTGQQITVDNADGGTYRVTFTDAQGCSSATDEIEVEALGQNILPRIEARLAEDGTILTNGDRFFAGNDVILTVSNLPDGVNFTYDWAGNYEPATGQGPEIRVSVPRSQDGLPDPLSYTVTVTVEGSDCPFEARIFLTVEQSQVVAPDFFTPDNDGRNDRFRLFYNGTITDYTMIVYDRWGQKVFTSDDPQEGWDGTKNGTPQNADTYLYLAKFRQDGAELQREGQVSLLR